MRHLLAGLAAAALMTGAPYAACALSHFGLVDTGELFASADGGASWSIRSTLPVHDATALIAGATSSQLFLASRGGSFYASADAGMSWAAISTVPASDVATLVPYPGRLLLVTRSGSVYASLDGGASFSPVGTLTASDLVGVARLGTSLFAVTGTGSVYRSTDAGATWSPVGSLPASNAVAMAAFADGLYVLTATGEVARSDDLGASWSFVSTLSQSGMTSLLATTGELLVATAAGEVAASVDGVTWSWRGTINQLTVMGLANDSPNFTAVALPDHDVLRAFQLGSNPARDQATVLFDLEREVEVTLIVHDVAGREIARPIAGERLPAGRVSREWRPVTLASGLYFLSARIGERRKTRMLAWLR